MLLHVDKLQNIYWYISYATWLKTLCRPTYLASCPAVLRLLHRFLPGRMLCCFDHGYNPEMDEGMSLLAKRGQPQSPVPLILVILRQGRGRLRERLAPRRLELRALSLVSLSGVSTGQELNGRASVHRYALHHLTLAAADWASRDFIPQ